MAKVTKRLVICIANNGYEVSLERRKIYIARRGGVEFSDDFFIVKHHQSLAQLVTDHLVLRQGVAAVQRIR
jgi:hypothetical protein